MTKMIEKRFCSKCGSLLKYKYKFHHFNTANGIQVYTVKAICPKHNHWWNISHDNYWLTEHGYNRYFYSSGNEQGEL